MLAVLPMKLMKEVNQGMRTRSSIRVLLIGVAVSCLVGVLAVADMNGAEPAAKGSRKSPHDRLIA